MLAWAAMDSPSIQSLPKRPAPLNNFDSDSLSTALKTHFGHREFRAGQLEVVAFNAIAEMCSNLSLFMIVSSKCWFYFPFLTICKRLTILAFIHFILTTCKHTLV